MRLTIVVLAAALSLPAAAAAPALANDASTERRYVVQFLPGTAASDGVREVRAQGGEVEGVLEHVFSGAVARLSDRAVAALARSPRVTRVEADSLVRAGDTQSLPPWNLDRVDQGSSVLSGSYGYTSTGTGVTAYVVDSGVRADHVDLQGRVAAGFTAIDDGIGTSDCNGHGTHVAGTVGGRAHGVAKAVRLVPVRVLGCDGSGTMSGVVSGLDWLVGQHATSTPAVANLSLGGVASKTLDDAVQATIDDAVTVVVAAGNADRDACEVSPARVAAAVAVGATDRADSRAPFSNYGACLDLFAPGVGVVSAWPSSSTATASLSGTSMAAPHVAGAAALVLQRTPSATPGYVSQRLLERASTGRLGSAGPGSPDRLLFSRDLRAPGVVTGLSVRPGLGRASLSWTPPADADLAAVVVRLAKGTTPPATPTAGTGVAGSLTGATATGLAGGTDYAFAVFAKDGDGNAARPATSARLGTRVSAASSAGAVTYGQTLTVRGALVHSTSGAAVAGQPVQVLVRRRGTTTWSVLATPTTSSTGRVEVAHRPSSNVEYALRYLGGGTRLGSASPVAGVAVRQRVSAVLDRTSAPLGTSAYLSVTVAPSHAGQAVVLQRLVSGAWQDVSSRTLSTTSSYRFPLRPGSRGTFTYRARKAADGDHAAGASAARSLSVT